MSDEFENSFSAFMGERCIASGSLLDAVTAIKAQTEAGEGVLVFDDLTARVVDLDLRGSVGDVVRRFTPAKAPGRPKLGVVAREVTLLPRHWAWLAEQSGGASVALRRLVEAARKADDKADSRTAQAAAYRFMAAMVGDRPGYEEACRALFAADGAKFADQSQDWPEDIRDYARRLAAPVFGQT
jgi:hypothetical protein